MSLKRMDESLNDFNKALSLNPACSEAFYNRGNLFYYTGKPDNAISDYTKATELNPDYNEAYFNRAVVKFNLKDKDGACKDWLLAKETGNKQATAALDSYCK